MFDFVLGLDRWVARVVAYVSLMTDEYPPFRLDQGGAERAAVGEPQPAPEAQPTCGAAPLDAEPVVTPYRSRPATHQTRPWWSKLGRSPRSLSTASIAAGGWANVRNCLRSTLSPRFCTATTQREIGLRRG